MTTDGDDPRVIQSLAVTADDVVVAVESRIQRDERVVLRATPPFSGRMRARLHVPGSASDQEPEGVAVDPMALLDDDAPAYPRAGDTEDELRADDEVEYTVERHRERHERAVADWREAVREYIRSEVAVETAAGTRVVDVVVLG